MPLRQYAQRGARWQRNQLLGGKGGVIACANGEAGATSAAGVDVEWSQALLWPAPKRGAHKVWTRTGEGGRVFQSSLQ